MLTFLVLIKLKSHLKYFKNPCGNKKAPFEKTAQQNIYVTHKYYPGKQKNELEINNDQTLLSQASSSPTYSKVDFDCPQYNTLLSSNSYNPLKPLYYIDQKQRTNSDSEAEV